MVYRLFRTEIDDPSIFLPLLPYVFLIPLTIYRCPGAKLEHPTKSSNEKLWKLHSISLDVAVAFIISLYHPRCEEYVLAKYISPRHSLSSSESYKSPSQPCFSISSVSA